MCWMATEETNAAARPTRSIVVSAERMTDRRLRQLRDEDVAILRILVDPDELADAIDELDPEVIVVDTGLDGDIGFAVIEQVRFSPRPVGLLAVTPAPPQHDAVVRALAAGASGFVGADAPPEELGRAIRTVAGGERFLPVDVTVDLLAERGDDLGLTAAERDARLRNLVIGLIPLAGGLTAFMSLLWRRYLGTIGVRPVDLAIDPATRLVDAFFAISVLFAVFGPLLFIGTWLDLLTEGSHRRSVGWLVAHRRLARGILAVTIVAIGAVLAAVAQVILALFVGPLVGALLLAKTFDLDDDLPPALRLSRWDPQQATGAFAAIFVAALSVLSFEALVVGPDLRPDGAHGWLAPRVLGFRAQPMEATTVDTGQVQEMLYLGGNADLYVLVDPCDDSVVLVSVGSTKLEVIDEVGC